MPIKERIASILRQILPPAAYAKLRSVFWGRLRGMLGHRHPRVEIFSLTGDGHTRTVLGSVNVFRTTELCRLMTEHGSDKGAGWHNYTTVYSALFAGLKTRPGRLFELGLGTNDPALPSTMGRSGTPGASVRAWRDYFPGWEVFGADIDRNVLFEDERIMTFYCDQCSPASIHSLWETGVLEKPFDVMIEDGLHTFEANTCFLVNSIHKLSRGGFYVVEDVAHKDLEAWRAVLQNDYRLRYPDMSFYIAAIPNSDNVSNNNLVIAQRSATVVK